MLTSWIINIRIYWCIFYKLLEDWLANTVAIAVYWCIFRVILNFHGYLHLKSIMQSQDIDIFGVCHVTCDFQTNNSPPIVYYQDGFPTMNNSVQFSEMNLERQNISEVFAK